MRSIRGTSSRILLMTAELQGCISLEARAYQPRFGYWVLRHGVVLAGLLGQIYGVCPVRRGAPVGVQVGQGLGRQVLVFDVVRRLTDEHARG